MNKRDEGQAVQGRADKVLRWEWLPLLLVVLSMGLVYGDVIFAGRGFYLEDLTLYHHPMKKVVRDVIRDGEFPWWNPLVGAGQPMAANPAYEVFYPGQWPVLFGDFDTMFQLHIVLHAFLSALGMYLLSRSFGLGGLAAAVGAIAYGAGGPMLSMTKLLPFMFAMTWAPFLALFVRRYLSSGERRDLAASSLFAGLQLLVGEPVTVLQTWLVIIVYAIWRLAQEPTRQFARTTAVRLGAVILISSALASIQIIPALDHARDTVRSRGLSWEIASNWSTPPQRHLEVLFPGIHRQIHDASGSSLMRGMYGHDVPYIADLSVGLLPMVLALSFLLTERLGRRWIVGGLVALAFLSAGSHLPFFRMAYDAGLLRSIRYPEKFTLGIFFVTCLLAAAGAQRIASGDRRTRGAAFVVVGAWLAVAVIGVLAGSGEDPVVAEGRRRAGAVILSSRDYWLLAVPRGLLAVAVLSGANRRRLLPGAMVALVLLSAAELALAAREVAPRVDRSYFDAPKVLDEMSGAVGRLHHRAEISWWHDADPRAVLVLEDERYVWSAFRSGAFPLIPTASGIPIVLSDDLDETYLLPTADYRDVWSAVRRSSPGTEPMLLRMAGVEWVAMFDRSLSVETVARGGSPVVLKKTGDGERYWFATAVTTVASPDEFRRRLSDGDLSPTSAATPGLSFVPAPGRVGEVLETRSRIELDVESDGRSFLVLSMTPHKYWRATVDGMPASLIGTNVGFQGLEIQSGAHHVVLTYRNPLVLVGACLSGLTGVLLLGMGVRSTPRRQ